MRAGAAADRLHRGRRAARWRSACPWSAEATLRILPRSGRIAWVLRSRACLALPPAESPSTMNSSEPSAAVLVQSASLPGRRSFFTAVLREISFSARRRSRSSARSIDEIEQPVGLQRIARQPVVERVLDGLLDDALRFGGGEAVLGLALEFRLAHEHREHHRGAHHDVFGGDRWRRACPGRRARRDPSGRAAARCACPIHGCRRPASARCCNRTRESRRRRRSRPTAHSQAPWAPLRPDLPEKMSGCTSVSAWIAAPR